MAALRLLLLLAVAAAAGCGGATSKFPNDAPPGVPQSGEKR